MTRLVDGVTDLDAANLNTLDVGLIVFESPAGGLNYRVAAGNYWLVGNKGTTAVSFAETVDQGISPSVVTYVYLDEDGVLTDNETGFPTAQHYPLAEVTAGASAIDSILDKRPRVVHFGRSPTSVRSGFRSGEYYGQLQAKPQAEELQPVDTLIAVPWLVGETMTIDRIAIEVMTAQAGAVARIGLYAEHATNRLEPGALLEDLGTISTATTGVKELALSTPRKLNTGWIFPVVISSNAAVGLRAYGTTHTNTAPLGLNPANFNEAHTHWHGPAAGHAAASALPDPFPAAPVVQIDDQPILALRVQ